MSQKKYVSLNRLSEFLTKLKELFATKTELATKATVGHGIYYGTCDDSAGATIKYVTLTDGTGFELTTGTVVIAKFKMSNTAPNPMMNVNMTGAKYMKRQGNIAVPSSGNSGWQPGAVQIFVYDGENWVRDYWHNSTYANVNLGHGYGTCSTEEATIQKDVACGGHVPVIGGFLAVSFANAVPASSVMATNGSSQYKEVYYNGAPIVDGIIKANETALFVYDGTVYHLVAVNRDAYSKTEIDLAMEQKSQVQIITWEADD